MLLMLLITLSSQIEVNATIIPYCEDIILDENFAVLPDGAFQIKNGNESTVAKGPRKLLLMPGNNSIISDCGNASFFVDEKKLIVTEMLPKKKSILFFSLVSGVVGIALLLLWRR